MSLPVQICQKEVFIHDPFAVTVAQILKVYIEHKCIYFSYWKLSGKIFPFLNKPLEVFPNATIWKTLELNAATLVTGWSHVTHEVREKSYIQVPLKTFHTPGMRYVNVACL